MTSHTIVSLKKSNAVLLHSIEMLKSQLSKLELINIKNKTDLKKSIEQLQINEYITNNLKKEKHSLETSFNIQKDADNQLEVINNKYKDDLANFKSQLSASKQANESLMQVVDLQDNTVQLSVKK